MSNTPDLMTRELVTLSQRQFRGEVVALYLRGSAARDDWVPSLSDVDFFIVVRDRTLGDPLSSELFQRRLNKVAERMRRQWTRESLSFRAVPLSNLASNPAGSYFTGIDSQLLLGSDVLAQVRQPSTLNLSKFGASEFSRFSNYWVIRADTGTKAGSLLEEAAHQEYAVHKLAQAALLAKGIVKMRKQEVTDSFVREFRDPSLVRVVDQAQRLRVAWPNPKLEELKDFVREATIFPRMLGRQMTKG